MGPAAGRARAGAPVPGDPDLEPGAASLLRRLPPLSPGDERRAAGDVRAGRGQPRQRRRELDPDLRTLRRAGDGRARIGLRHAGGAHLHGRLAAGRDRPARGARDAAAARHAARASTCRASAGCSCSAFRPPARWCWKSACSPRRPRSPAASRPMRWRRTRSRSTSRRSPSWCRSASRRPRPSGSARRSAAAIRAAPRAPDGPRSRSASGSCPPRRSSSCSSRAS